jgi:hypothetical protein
VIQKTDFMRNWSVCMINFPSKNENFVRRSQGKKVVRHIFKLTVWNKSSHETSNDNGIRTVHNAT